MSPLRRLAILVVPLLVIVVAFLVVPISTSASHVPDNPGPCESGSDCIQQISRQVNEEGKFLAGLFGVLSPGQPLIMKSPPNATMAQMTVDRLMVAKCAISSGIGSEGTWECDWWGDNNIFWLEVGTIRRVGSCNHTVYTYCNKCGSDSGFRTHTNVTAGTGVGHFVKIWWEPSGVSVGPSTTGTWFVAWQDRTIRQAVAGAANAVFAGSRTTHARNDLGVTWITGNHFGLKNNNSPTSSIDWNPWNGPFFWSVHDIPRFDSARLGSSDFNLFTQWHRAGQATPTPVPEDDIGCDDNI